MKRLLLGCLCLFVSQWAFLQNPNLQFELKSEFVAPFPASPLAIVPDKLGRPFFYVAAKAGGLEVFKLENESTPMLLTSISISAFSNLEVMNASQRGNFLYLALGNFFGSQNLQAPGLAIVDISNPAQPVVRDVWTTGVVVQGSGSVSLEGDFAYLCAMKQGLILLNIANPDQIQFVSQITPDKNYPTPNPDATHEPRARSVEIRNEVAFLCYDAGGIRVINLTDKLHPIETGRYINPTPFQPVGKQQAFNHLVLDGDKAYVAVDYCGMEVLDISDTAHIVPMGWWNPWQCESLSNLWLGSPGHTNQMAYDAARHLVFLASGQSELSVVDVSTPELPTLAGGYGSTDNGIGTWGMALDGNRVFLAYIVAVIPFASNWAGIKILHWTSSSGTSAPVLLEDFQVSPNPFQEDFNLEFELIEAKEIQATLLNAQGRIVAEWPAQYLLPGKHDWHWQGKLPAGLYLLQIRSSNGWMTRKLIKTF